MGFFDSILGNKNKTKEKWTPMYRGVVQNVDYSEIELELGGHTTSEDGFIYWSGSLSELDEDLPSNEFFQLSNKDPGGGIRGRYSTRLDKSNNSIPEPGRDKWFVVATSAAAIESVGRVLGGITRSIESL